MKQQFETERLEEAEPGCPQPHTIYCFRVHLRLKNRSQTEACPSAAMQIIIDFVEAWFCQINTLKEAKKHIYQSQIHWKEKKISALLH